MAEGTVIVPIGSTMPAQEDIDRDIILGSVGKVEELDEEDYVLESLMKNIPRDAIAKTLSDKHKKRIVTYDITSFVQKSPYVMKFLKRRYEGKALKLLAAEERCQEIMADLVLKVRDLIDKYDAQGDNLATIAAVRALNNTMETYAELAGFTKRRTINIENMTVTNQVSKEQQSKMAKKVVEVSFSDDILDADIVRE